MFAGNLDGQKFGSHMYHMHVWAASKAKAQRAAIMLQRRPANACMPQGARMSQSTSPIPESYPPLTDLNELKGQLVQIPYMECPHVIQLCDPTLPHTAPPDPT
jgi:hypothetical protein